MEKILDRTVRDIYLPREPLHPRQFAYQEGKSTTTAVKSLVMDIEKTLKYKQSDIGISFDIQGAFDNVSHEVIRKALVKKKVPDVLTNWICIMLSKRSLQYEFGGETIYFKPIKGCPLGGSLSPLLWTLVVDTLLHKINDLHLRTNGLQMIYLR